MKKRSTPDMVRVIVKPSDHSLDYWLLSERALRLYREGKLLKTQVYNKQEDYYDPSATYKKDRVL